MSSILAHPNYTQEQITQGLIMKAGMSRMSHAHDQSRLSRTTPDGVNGIKVPNRASFGMDKKQSPTTKKPKPLDLHSQSQSPDAGSGVVFDYLK